MSGAEEDQTTTKLAYNQKGVKNMSKSLLASYTPGHYSTTVRDFGQLPKLFTDSWLEKCFGDATDVLTKAFDAPNVHYPYNVVERYDGEVLKEYIVEVALAGVGKDNIEVKVQDNYLSIIVKNEEAEETSNVKYLRHGISKRKSSLRFHIGEQIDAKGIRSTYADGLLKVVAPVKQPETINIDISVD
jgi:HSP20 family molecular chaperone IbpA